MERRDKRDKKKEQAIERQRCREQGIYDENMSMEEEVKDLRRNVSNIEILLSDMAQSHSRRLVEILNAVEAKK